MTEIEPVTAAVTLERAPDPVAPVAYARTHDLALPEFRAWDESGELPRMRRWEQPFALVHARLESTARVLDCSINPSGFGERIARLYRHVLYRHVSPIEGATFVPPLGVPDRAFDRIFCVNTLEHLTQDQRAALATELVRKLRPGGAIVVTMDQYFDDSWNRPAFLELGVMRADGSEIFGGYNRVTPTALAANFARHGLVPVGPLPSGLPERHDASLYVQAPPFEHATFGAVFAAEGTVLGVAAKRIVVLGLLTWNTREPSLEALAAHVGEAHVLERLGHEVLVCVCDNGSIDGTAEALREVDGALHVPHRFLFNDRNRGNSIARNQIIDVALELGADYLLFVDGDIELVPFSSVAMLRYSEDHGHRLGCIGADSATCTPLRASAATIMRAVDSVEDVNLVAWTQYGLFRCDVFRDGIRFEDAPPFDGVGWGFEDNDLAFQMITHGYVIRRFFGVPYLHRSARSSIRVMRDTGIDPEYLYGLRRERILNKWKGDTKIDVGPLADVAMARIPMG